MTAKPYGPMAPDGSQYITLTDGAGNLVTSLAPSGAAGGDLTGTFPNPTLATTQTGAHTWSSTQTLTANTALGTALTPDSLLTLNSNTAGSVTPPAGTMLHLVGADSTSLNLDMDSYSASPIIYGRRANGTQGAKAVASAADGLLILTGLGWNGSAYAQGGQWQVTSRETWSGSANGASLSAYTVPLTTTSAVEAVRIQPSGGLSVGSTAIASDPGIGAINAAVISAPSVLVNGGIPAALLFKLSSANFNSTADQAITITLPTGYTRYRLTTVFVSNPSTSLTTAAGGFYTAASKGGVAVVAAGTTYSSLTNNTAGTSGSLLLPTVVNSNAAFYNAGTIYLSLTTPQGSAATADIAIQINPLP